MRKLFDITDIPYLQGEIIFPPIFFQVMGEGGDGGTHYIVTSGMETERGEVVSCLALFFLFEEA